MTRAAKHHSSATAVPLDTPARWEQRSASRVLETGHDTFLERSRKIVEAAYDLLEESGLEGLTVRAVLKKTGLSRRAFYERFAGKDDLLLAVFEQTIRFAVNHYGEQAETIADPLERLRLIVTGIVLGRSSLTSVDDEDSNRLSAAMSREHLRLAEARPDDLQAALKPLIAFIARQLSDGMELGSIRKDDPHRLAPLVYNLVSTTVHTELLSQESAQPDWAHRERLAADIWEFCRRAIAA